MELAVAGQIRSQPADDRHSARCTVAIKVNGHSLAFYVLYSHRRVNIVVCCTVTFASR